METQIRHERKNIRKSGKGEGRIVPRLVNIDRALLVIPNLAIHMNHEINDGQKYNPQKQENK